jgi:hypothetical protein
MTFEQERKTILDCLNSGSYSFEVKAVRLFHFQHKYNAIYRQYCIDLKINPQNVTSIDLIPFLPISAFKHHEVKTGIFTAEDVFLSSGTTHMTVRSSHHVRDVLHYHQNASHIWHRHFDNVSDYCYLALLPGYLERDGSSLISMVNHFISRSRYLQSGFYLRNHDKLIEQLTQNKKEQIPTILFGVSYALLDLLETNEIDFPELIIMETGGMKGSRPEMTKTELHQILCHGYGTDKVMSEYGMTELLSQAYASDAGVFVMNDRLCVYVTQLNDPMTIEKNNKSGIINIIDLANVDSCSFIQSQDLGKIVDPHHFMINGRLDDADIRGCNLMIEELG